MFHIKNLSLIIVLSNIKILNFKDYLKYKNFQFHVFHIFNNINYIANRCSGNSYYIDAFDHQAAEQKIKITN